MVKSKIKILIKKYGRKTVISGITVILGIWLTTLLTPLFNKLNQFLIEKSRDPILSLIIFITSKLNIKVPVYSILLFILIAWLIFKFIRILTLSRRRFKIIKAEYGSGTTFVDITNQLNNFVIDNKISVLLTNSIAGLDPTPGVVKVAKIKYELNGKKFDKKIIEGKIINLP